MHFEPAKQEKKRMSPLIPAILLVVWMIGSTWYWVCGVKGMCTGDSVLEETKTD